MDRCDDLGVGNRLAEPQHRKPIISIEVDVTQDRRLEQQTPIDFPDTHGARDGSKRTAEVPGNDHPTLTIHRNLGYFNRPYHVHHCNTTHMPSEW